MSFQRFMVETSSADLTRAFRFCCRSRYAIALVMLESRREEPGGRWKAVGGWSPLRSCSAATILFASPDSPLRGFIRGSVLISPGIPSVRCAAAAARAQPPYFCLRRLFRRNPELARSYSGERSHRVKQRNKRTGWR